MPTDVSLGIMVVDWMIRGATAAFLLAAAVGIIFSARDVPLRIVGPCFLATAAVYAINAAPYATQILGPAKILTSLIVHGGGGWFWLFTQVSVTVHSQCAHRHVHTSIRNEPPIRLSRVSAGVRGRR